MGAFYPLGLAFYGRWRSRGTIETILAQSLESRIVDDPLLRFVEQLCRGKARHDEETVNLSSLISCQGAVSDALKRVASTEVEAAGRIANVGKIAEIALRVGWIPQLPHASLRTGVLVLQAERSKVRQTPAEELRLLLHDNGILCSAYDNGLLRLSMPATPLKAEELDRVRDALRNVV